MFAGRSFLVEALSNNTIAKEAVAASTPEAPAAGPKYTDEELTAVEVMMKELEEWVDEVMTKQVFLEADKTETPVVMTKELNDKGKKLQTAVSNCDDGRRTRKHANLIGTEINIEETT